MRLAIHTQYYPPEMGAPQARLSELARLFATKGHEIHVLTAMPNYPRGRVYPGYGGVYRKETSDGITVRRSYIRPSKSVGLLPRLSNYFSFVGSSAVVGSLALPRVDYLLTESPPLFLGWSGFLLSRLKRARWIFNVSDLWPESAVRLGVVNQGWALRAAERLEAFCYRKAWLVTGQSKEILADINARFPSVPTYHLSNGVDTNAFTPERRSEKMRARLLEGSGASCVALYAGLHGVAQGLEQVLEAASRLADVSELTFVLVGDGAEKEKLIERSRTLGLNNVRFWDPLPRGEMAELVASADISLVPLGMWLPGAVPSKLYEGMGSGVPVVLVAQGEAVDILKDSQAGIAVPPGDVDGLTEALRSLASDPEKRRALGENGRQAAIARFDRTKIVDAFIKHLEARL